MPRRGYFQCADCLDVDLGCEETTFFSLLCLEGFEHKPLENGLMLAGTGGTAIAVCCSCLLADWSGGGPRITEWPGKGPRAWRIFNRHRIRHGVQSHLIVSVIMHRVKESFCLPVCLLSCWGTFPFLLTGKQLQKCYCPISVHLQS